MIKQWIGHSWRRRCRPFRLGSVDCWPYPKWDWRTATLGHEVRLADEKAASILNSWNPDLRSFRAHGGKLIQYHGWEDAAIAPRDSINYYEQVRAFLNTYPDPRSTGAASIESFYRLFMVPEMQHCGGGQGATNFGNGDISEGIPDDAGHDVILALDQWVTQGVAPERIIANGTIGADAKAGAADTRLTRPLCVYPAVARYTGDTNSAENFACVAEPSK